MLPAHAAVSLWCAASGVLRPLPVFDLPSLGQGGFGCEGA